MLSHFHFISFFVTQNDKQICMLCFCLSSYRLTPLGVFFLVAAKMLEMTSLQETLQQLGWYFCTVMLGLFIHGFGTIAIIFLICCHKLPYAYISRMGQNLATAFGTGSRYKIYLFLYNLPFNPIFTQ